MATAAALSIPEILREILTHVSDSRPTLAAAARVNRAWSAQALDLLWQRPPEDAFVDLPRRRSKKAHVAARRQFYAAKVRRIRLLHDPAPFLSLAFPQLREARLYFTSYDVQNEGVTLAAAVAPFVCSPLLERLDLHIDPGVVELLLTRRPRLRELEILGFDGELVRFWM